MESITYHDKIQSDQKHYMAILSPQELELLGEIKEEIKF